MSCLRFIHKLARDHSGATLAEFALVGPLLLMTIIGGIYISMLGFTAASLHYAVQAAARCKSINTTICTDSTTTETFASGKFINLTGATPTFDESSATCGSQVSGSLTFKLSTGLRDLSIPLSSTACFPT